MGLFKKQHEEKNFTMSLFAVAVKFLFTGTKTPQTWSIWGVRSETREDMIRQGWLVDRSEWPAQKQHTLKLVQMTIYLFPLSFQIKCTFFWCIKAWLCTFVCYSNRQQHDVVRIKPHWALHLCFTLNQHLLTAMFGALPRGWQNKESQHFQATD